MVSVKTIFKIENETYAVEGSGQKTVSAILKQFPRKRIFLVGFQVNEIFIPAMLD